MTNCWPPQPGDLVKVERSTFYPNDETRKMIGKIVAITDIAVPFLGPVAEINDQYFFNLSDLSPAEPPQTIEQFGRTYRLVEEESDLVGKLKAAASKGVSVEQSRKQRESYARSCVKEPTP